MFLQIVKLTGFLHPLVKKGLADQAFLSGEGEGKVRLKECFHTGHFRSRMNVQKGVEILGEAAGSESDGLVGQLPMGVGRMVICLKVVGLILLMSKCSTMLPVTSSSGLRLLNYPVGEWENKKNLKQALFIMKL